MCIIIDANQASLFVEPDNENYKPIFKWLEKDGRIIYGKKLLVELSKIEKMGRLLLAYSAAGKARYVDEAGGEAILFADKTYGKIKSNDHHIIGIAAVSKARILCTVDQKLIEDFTNKEILKPLGKVYKNANHKHLLKHHSNCKF